MYVRLLHLIIVFVVGLVYWLVLGKLVGLQEPWDAAVYWTVAYPISIALAALFAVVFRHLSWRAGLVITFGQLPILLGSGGLEPTIFFAIGILLALSILPIAAAALTARLIGKR